MTKQINNIKNYLIVAAKMAVFAILALSSLELAGWLNIDDRSAQFFGYSLGILTLANIAHLMQKSE